MALSPANYGQILNQVLNLSGIDRATLPTLEWNLFRDLSSRRLKYAWQAAKWPEVTVTESRTITQTGGDEGNYIALNQAGQTEIEHHSVSLVQEDSSYTDWGSLQLLERIQHRGSGLRQYGWSVLRGQSVCSSREQQSYRTAQLLGCGSNTQHIFRLPSARHLQRLPETQW
jgi:hypothetical protein